jgi:hypothetical protein
MIGFPAKSVRLMAVIGALFLAAFGNAWAAEQQFADDNCAITIPDTWLEMTNVSPQPGVLAIYCDATGDRRVVLQTIKKKPSAPLDDRFIDEFEQGYQGSSGARVLSGKYIEVDGIKSYEMSGSLFLPGKHISVMLWLVPGENQYYNIQALRFDGDASQDPEVRQVIGSFRFLHHFVPSYPPDSISYRIGKLTGALTVAIVVVAIVVSSSRSKRSPRPPPLPPN